MEYVLFGHGGSGNHGCEAIIRTTIKMLPDKSNVNVYSSNIEKDIQFDLLNSAMFHQYRGKSESVIRYYGSKIIHHLTGNYDFTNRYELGEALEVSDAICLSVGGDNYCNAEPRRHSSRNKLFCKKNKTVLWGCSITPSLLNDSYFVHDMKRYSLITARESITFNALINAGVDCAVLVPDPAFTLDILKTNLPSLFSERKVVGINISPLILKHVESAASLVPNIKQLINFIMRETDFGIALIPHVLLENNNDLVPLKTLFEEYRYTNRICLVDEDDTLNCQQLKYIISKCSFMVAARTHASIAAYSTCVPTLVLGYSVKSTGIATDIFGSPDHYVLPVDKITGVTDVTQAFSWILDNAESIKNKYETVMPNYINNAYLAGTYLSKIRT